MPVTEVRIRGQRELERAYLQLRREVLVGIKPALLDIGRVVAEDAHRRAPSDITNVGDAWSQFRVGATVKGIYIAPKQRRRGGSPRRNMGGLLLKVMEEAADAHRDEAWEKLNLLVDGAAARSGLLL